ncbi:hypothetical protein LguiA_032244 [Lonicera macranthoides]
MNMNDKSFYEIMKKGKIIWSSHSVILTISKNCSYYDHSDDGSLANMPLSSSGSGHLSFKEVAGIRLPLGVGYWERELIVDYQ